MKVLVIGNSHIAALMNAAREVEATHPGWQFDFLGAPGAHHDWFRLGEDRMLSIITPERFGPAKRQRKQRLLEKINGMTTRSVADFGMILRYGMMPGRDAIQQLIGFYAVDGFPKRPAGHRMSAGLFRRICKALSEGDLLGNGWRRPHRFRIVNMPQPFRSGHLIQRGWQPLGAHYRHLIRFPDYAEQCFARYEEQVAADCAEAGGEFLGQPSKTIVPGLLTDVVYSKGAARLLERSAEKKAADITHMNADYGKEVLESLIRYVTEGQRPEPARPSKMETEHGLGS